MATASRKPERVNVAELRAEQDKILDDILQVKISSVNNVYKAIKEAIGQRVGIVQDIMNVSLAALGGAITIKIFSPDTLKTPLLFHCAVAVLLTCIIICLIIRMTIANLWTGTAFSLGESEEALRMAVGNMRFHDTGRHSQAHEDLDQAIESVLDVPEVPWLARMPAITILCAVFIIGLVSIALSLLFKISIS